MNVFTDENRKGGRGDGKELCDLMVVFGNDILLFSDKNCAFPPHPNINVAWSRWYRRAIKKSADQLLGAESWIRRYPNRVFLDRHCTHRFPIPIPDMGNAKFHRIAVTRGAYTRCREFFSGESTGSLVIDTRVHAEEHLQSPFTVGLVAPNRSYVHVLDELTLEVVLRELDTVSDLVAYLKKKEALLAKPGRTVLATGEEQLVSMYLTHMNKDNEHDFGKIPSDVNFLFVQEGHWEDFIRSPQYRAKKDADRVSYAWDRLIEHFTANGFVNSGDDTSTGPRDLEIALRVLASEPRIRRRQLAAQLLEAINKEVRPDERFTRLGISNDFPDTAYVFLILPRPTYVSSYEEYQEGRRAFLLASCKVAKLRVPSAKRIVGIATEPARSGGASEDLLLLEAHDEAWTSELENEAKELQETLGILQEATTTYRETHDKEYPDRDLASPKPIQLKSRPQPVSRAQRRNLERRQRREAKRRRDG